METLVNNNLITRVLGWTKQDYNDDKHYKKDLIEIPERFESERKYYQSFVLPFYDDLKCNIAREWNKLKDKYEVVGKVSILNFSISNLESKVVITSDIDPSKIYVDDLVLLSPNDSFSLNDSNQNYLICVVNSKKTLGNTLWAEVQTNLSENMQEYEMLLHQETSWKMARIASLTSQIRISDALSARPNFKLLKNIMNPDIQFKIPDKKISSDLSVKLEIIRSKRGSELNEYQTQAVINAVCNAHNGRDGNDDQYPYLLRGPPGTGKTHTIIHLLILLCQEGFLVHQTAPTNIALGEVAKRLVQVLEESNIIGFKNILLVGNGERIMQHSHISAIFLDDRCERIIQSFRGFNDSHKKIKELIEDTRGVYIYDNSKVGKKPTDEILVKYIRENALPTIQEIFGFIDTIQRELPDNLLNSIKGISGIIEKYKTLQLHINNFVTLQEIRGKFSALQDHLRLKFKFYFSENGGYSYTYGLRSESDRAIMLLKQEFIDKAKILFSTVNFAGRYHLKQILEKKNYVVITDEASQVTEAEQTILFRNNVSSMILIGDDKQLGATVFSMNASLVNYGRSLFARLVRLKFPFDELMIQYRMKPEIAEFPSSRFYDGNLENGKNVQMYDKPWYTGSGGYHGPLMFFDVNGKEEISADFSYFNQVEIEIIKKLVIDVISNFPREKMNIGIIAGYAGQVELLREMINSIMKLYPRIQEPSSILGSCDFPVDVTVKTVDGFQGQEKDIIIFSAVRCNSNGEIGFLRDNRRLNVAITRPKYSLWVVGSSRTLGRYLTLKRLIEHIKSHGKIVKCSDDPSFSDIVMIEKNTALTQDLFIDQQLLDCLWKIDFSDKCRKVFLKMPVHELKKIFKRIVDIFSGGYSKKYITGYSYKIYDNFIRLISMGTNVLFWTVSLNVEFSCQSIKLWSFCDGSSRDRTRRLIENALNQYSEQYIGHCGKIFMEHNAKIIPESYDNIPECWIRKSESSKDENIYFQETSIDLIKTYTLSSHVYERMIDRSLKDFEWDFNLSPQENRLIKDSSTLFILGRSGTGKTTVAVRKMVHLHKWMLHQNNLDSKFKQLYVTSSKRLADSVHAEFTKFTRGTNLDIKAYSSATITSFEEIEDVGSIMLSFFDLLLLIDKSDGGSFFGYDSSSSQRYMRETDLKIKKYGFHVNCDQVDYKRFECFYYPHFNQNLCKIAYSVTLWTEFFSIIKGSDPSLMDNGRLSLDDYVGLASSRGSVFTVEERRMIYAAFLRYESMKNEKNEWDMMDFCHHIHRRLLTRSPIKFEKIYLDEVQDLNMFQISIFSNLGLNKDSFIFGGDTAQTIASGVSFRFESIRSLFYRGFLPAMNAHQSCANIAPLINLTVNYRSHNGILTLAQTVVNMIFHFFPLGIDKLDPEVGLISGLKPIFIKTSFSSLLAALFKKNDKGLCFNANQVVIVKDASTKREVEKISQERALVLTISECKGLEFEFVILYDFFSSSTFDSWRVLFGYSGVVNDNAYTLFDSRKHSQLEKELKSLYVAITRAKSTLWIVESDNFAKSDPMIYFWRELIKTRSLDSLIQDVRNNSLFFANESTDAEWIQLADSLYEKKLFNEAKRFYINGNCSWKATLMEALQFREEASRLDGAPAKQLNVCAAKAFAKIKKWKESGDSYFEAQEYKLAAVSFLKLPDDEMLLIAIIMCYLGRLTKLCLEILDNRKFIFDNEEDENNRIKRSRDDICTKFALYELERGHMREFELFIRRIGSFDESRKILKRYKQFDLLITLEKEFYEVSGKVTRFLPPAFLAVRDLKNAGLFFGLIGDINSKAECLLVLLRQHVLLYWINNTNIKPFFVDLGTESPLDNSHLPIFNNLDALDKEGNLPTTLSLEIEIWREFFNQNRLETYFKLYQSKRFSSNLYLSMLLSVFIACQTNFKNIMLEGWYEEGLEFISNFQTNYLALISQLNDFSKPGTYLKHIKAFFAIENSTKIYFARTKGGLLKDVWKDSRQCGTSAESFDELKKTAEEAFLNTLRIWYQLLSNFLIVNRPAPLLKTLLVSFSSIETDKYWKTDLSIKLTLVRLFKHWEEHGNNPPKVFRSLVNQFIAALRPSIDSSPVIVAEIRCSLLGKEVVEELSGNVFELLKTKILTNYHFANKKKVLDCSDLDFQEFVGSVLALGRNPRTEQLSYCFRRLFTDISTEEMLQIARSCLEFADWYDLKLTKYFLLSMIARNFPRELYSNVEYITQHSILLKNAILGEISPPRYRCKSPLFRSMENGVQFLLTRIAGRNILWSDYILLIERMTYIILILDFKLKNIKISNHIFYGAYMDYWPSIWAHCNGKWNDKPEIWNSSAILSNIIVTALTERFVFLLKSETAGKNEDSNDIYIAEITLRFIKVYLHLYNHYHSENIYSSCPVKEILNSKRGKIYQTLAKAASNPYILEIAKKFRICVIDHCQNGIKKFFQFFRDDLFILSLENGNWKPWMKPYSRFIVDDKKQLVEIFEKDWTTENDTTEQDIEELRFESTFDSIEETSPEEFQLSYPIIHRMREWAKMAKLQLHKLSNVSSLPLWDKKRLEVETQYLFRKNNFNLDSSKLKKYLDESLDLLSRIHCDLNDIDNCLDALKFDKFKQQFSDIHEEVDHLLEYKELLNHHLLQVTLTKSLLESDIKLEIAKVCEAIDRHCKTYDIKNRIEKIKRSRGFSKWVKKSVRK